MGLEKPDQQRLFFALWPSVELAQRFHQFASHHLSDVHGRLLKPEQIHLTLRFIGSVTNDVAASLQEAVETVSVAPFELHFDQLGYWPRPRVVWCMPSSVPQEMTDLAIQVEQACRDCGLSAESRPYVPHLTLMRNVRRRPREQQMPLISWPIENFALVQSETLPQGAVYTVLRRWPLQ